MAMAVGIGEGNSVAGGGSLSELYQSSRRLLLKSRDGLERLERFEYTSSSSSSSIPSSSSSTAIVDPSEQSFDAVRKEIAQIQSLCSEMELLWRSIPAKSQRDLWKRYASFSFFLVGFWSPTLRLIIWFALKYKLCRIGMIRAECIRGFILLIQLGWDWNAVDW